MEKANVFGDFAYDPSDPAGYRSGMARVGQLAGGKANIVKAYEMPAGESLCPYHYEYVEEWLLVLEGDILFRPPEGEQPRGRGDLIFFPAGPAGAHKLLQGLAREFPQNPLYAQELARLEAGVTR